MEMHEFEWRIFSVLGIFFGILGTLGLQHKERIQGKKIELSTKDWDLGARSQIRGYVGLQVGINKKVVKISSSCLAILN